MKNSIVIAGDFFPTEVNQFLFKSGNLESLFDQKIIDLFKDSFYSVCNLEGVFTDAELHVEKVSGPCIKAPKECFRIYKDLGVKCLATANNHIMDYLLQGYEDTRRLLEDNELDCIGSGRDYSEIVKYKSLEVNGHSVCIYNVAETMYNVPEKDYPGANVYDEYLVCKDIESLKKSHSCLIVIYHGGLEWFEYPTPELRKRFHRMADCGADIIVSQHTHCLGCEESYGGAYLLYGQGNFLFTRHNRHRGGGVLLEVDFGGNLPTIKLHHYLHSESGVYYDDNQNLDAFNERSSHLDNEEFIETKLIAFASSLYPSVLSAFQPYGLVDRFAKVILPSNYYRAYRKKFRTRRLSNAQVLQLCFLLQSEQQAETISFILKGLLGSKSI